MPIYPFIKRISLNELKPKRVQSWFATLPLIKAMRAIALTPFLRDIGQPVILTSLIVTGSLLAIRQVGGLENFELAAYDHLIGLRPDAGEDHRLLIVGITEEDIQARKEWPISDQTLSQLLAKLETYQPRVISVDIMRDVAIEPGREDLLDLLTSSENIINVCKVSTENNIGVPPPPGVSPDFVGFADLVIDPGGTLRRSLLWMTPPSPSGDLASQSRRHLCSDSETVLSLSLQSVFYYLAQEDIYPELTDKEELKLGDTTFPPLQPSFGGIRRLTRLATRLC